MKLKVVLFALTGLGNEVLKCMLKSKIKPIALITRKEVGPFPYFKCENISAYAKKNGIKVFYDKTYYKESADLYLVATYHKKIDIKKSTFKKGLNIHPSYLPQFPGKDPIKYALMSSAKYTGVSVHKLTNTIDKGKIIKKKKIFIKKSDNKSTILKKMLPIYGKYCNFILNNYKSVH